MLFKAQQKQTKQNKTEEDTKKQPDTVTDVPITALFLLFRKLQGYGKEEIQK